MIVNATRITVKAENRGELYQTICPLLEPIRRERGCRTYQFYIDAVDENSSMLIGEWNTREDWLNHLRSRDFAVLLGAITILASPSSVYFQILSSLDEVHGLDRRRLFKLGFQINDDV